MEIIAKDEKREGKQHSLYTQCYVQGIKLILNDIILREEQEIKDINNIITFMGGRGTGKTTVLTEFSEILKNSDEKKLCNYLENNGRMIDRDHCQRKIKFTVLPMIDASLLETGEDPFLLTLASMLNECEEQWNYDISFTSFEKQEISRAFNEVYRNYSGVQNKILQEDFGESIISKLRSMPSSNKAKEEFDKLLRLFFNTISKSDKITNYLVVVIDDLDLNIRKGLKMLEQLYKYLSHKRVIIITAVDYKQLSVIAERHFIEDQFKGSKEKLHIKQSKALALDYLDKFLPVAHRIYMPDIVKVGEELVIKVNEGNESGLKAYILNKVAEKMYIYYDSVGTKRHFAEQDTVRKIVFYSEFLDSLNNVVFSDCKMIKGICAQENKEEIVQLQNIKMKRYDENHERFNSDIKERMLYEKTTVEQRELFDLLLQRDLGRRARYLIEFKERWRNNEPLDADIDYREYCYGDILECIYKWGRESLVDKPLLHCIMASFTSEMVREYLNYMYSGKVNSRKRSKERLQQFIGVSFMSKWTNEMLPFLNNEFGWLSRNVYSDLELSPIKYECSLFVKNSEQKTEEESIENFMRDILKQIEEKRLIKILECMDMLLSNCKTGETGSEHVEYLIRVLEGWEKDEIVIEYRFKTEKATFDIGGFVIKSIEPVGKQIRFAREIAKKVTNAITRYLIKKYGKSILDIETKKEKIQQELEKQSMFYHFDRLKDNVAFPFFDLDVSYNVIKRVRKKCKKEMGWYTDTREMFEVILKIYDYIEVELGRQNESCVQNQYRDIFINYPFIVTMKELEKSDDLKDFINILLNAGLSLPSPESYVTD